MRTEQIERWQSGPDGDKRYKKRHKLYGRIKRAHARMERRKARQNPECHATYRRYCGWEY